MLGRSAITLSMQMPAAEPYLPPGYRFHPTDEELVVYYLANKVTDCRFTVAAIAEVDLNKCEPWELPDRAKMGEKEWYFFSLKDRKYPTGLRTNRATMAGYWKATGKDREVMSFSRYGAGCYLVGMKKTLVFYKGRAPKGEKTNWIMHEYRLEGESSLLHLTKAGCKDEWVVCRIFKKTCGGKKSHAEGGTDIDEQTLPALLESPHTHTSSVNGGEDIMCGNADIEQPGVAASDALFAPHYVHRNQSNACAGVNHSPNPSITCGNNNLFWGSNIGTMGDMNSSLAGLRYSEASYNLTLDNSAYPSIVRNSQVSESLNPKPGMHHVYPVSSLASEVRVVQTSPSSEGQCKAEPTPQVELQLTKFAEMYKDTNSWSGSMMLGTRTEETASNPQINTAHHMNLPTHLFPTLNFCANQSINQSTTCGNVAAINQAMDLVNEGMFITPSQLSDFSHAITPTAHPYVGAVWASQC